MQNIPNATNYQIVERGVCIPYMRIDLLCAESCLHMEGHVLRAHLGPRPWERVYAREAAHGALVVAAGIGAIMATWLHQVPRVRTELEPQSALSITGFWD